MAYSRCKIFSGKVITGFTKQKFAVTVFFVYGKYVMSLKFLDSSNCSGHNISQSCPRMV